MISQAKYLVESYFNGRLDMHTLSSTCLSHIYTLYHTAQYIVCLLSLPTGVNSKLLFALYVGRRSGFDCSSWCSREFTSWCSYWFSVQTNTTVAGFTWEDHRKDTKSRLLGGHKQIQHKSKQPFSKKLQRTTTCKLLLFTYQTQWVFYILTNNRPFLVVDKAQKAKLWLWCY